MANKHIIDFSMALAAAPEKVREFQYKPFSRIAVGGLPRFYVVEKGKQEIQLVIEIKEDGLEVRKGERSEFSQVDTEEGIKLIFAAIAAEVAAQTPDASKVN